MSHVQVCFMGLSLVAKDIEWFENEECDDTRIRTIEPWEVEQQQILWRKVIERAGQYTFAMHTMRALLTNPARYTPNSSTLFKCALEKDVSKPLRPEPLT